MGLQAHQNFKLLTFLSHSLLSSPFTYSLLSFLTTHFTSHFSNRRRLQSPPPPSPPFASVAAVCFLLLSSHRRRSKASHRWWHCCFSNQQSQSNRKRKRSIATFSLRFSQYNSFSFAVSFSVSDGGSESPKRRRWCQRL